jgi:hypothetical protein
MGYGQPPPASCQPIRSMVSRSSLRRPRPPGEPWSARRGRGVPEAAHEPVPCVQSASTALQGPAAPVSHAHLANRPGRRSACQPGTSAQVKPLATVNHQPGATEVTGVGQRKAPRHRATPGGYGGKPPGVAFIGVPTGARNAGHGAPTGDQSTDMNATRKPPRMCQDPITSPSRVSAGAVPGSRALSMSRRVAEALLGAS